MTADSREPDWSPAPHLKLSRRLGAGGMGEVWLAEDARRGHAVALKRLHLIRSEAGPEDRLRFKREYRLLSGLSIEGIVRVFDYHEDERDAWYTMEHVAGWPLRDYLDKGRWREGESAGPPDAGERLEQLWRLADALLAALGRLHAENLIHRDLKPANLMVAADRGVRLIDFGLARPAVDALVITGAGELLGTPGYLAPEQVRVQPLDGRADLYALGIILYELAAGRHPFHDARAPAEMLMAHLINAPPDPLPLNPRLNPGRAAFILRLLAKEPAGRFASAAEARRALAACADAQRELTIGFNAVTTGLALSVELAAPDGLLIAPLTGHAPALAALREGGEALLRGEGRLLVISGAAGAGKSRLADELRAFAAGRGLRLWRGAAREAGALPGQLFHELFAGFAGQYAAQPERAREWLGAEGPVLARHFPALRPLVEADAPPLEPEAERGRLQAALYAFFARIAGQAPLAIVLDDLQWADPLSLELAAHLAAGFTGAGLGGRILLLALHRPPDDSAPEFPRWLSRLPASARLALAPLDADEVGKLVQGLLGLPAPAPPSFSRRLHDLTGGNPLFIAETLKSLLADGALHRARAGLGESGWNFEDWLRRTAARPLPATLPDAVRDALERRLRALSEPAWTALQAGALLGREFRFAWWAALTGLGEDALIDLAEPALRLGILTEPGGDRLRFANEQLRTALLAGLSGMRRRRLHARALAALEGDPAAPRALLTEHALEASDPAAVIRHGHPFIADCLALFQGDMALQLLNRVESVAPSADLQPADRLQRLRLRCQIHGFRGEVKDLLPVARVAVELAQTEGDRRSELELRLQLSMALRQSGDNPAAIGEAILAAQIAEQQNNPSGLAMALCRRGYGTLYSGALDEAMNCFTIGFEIASGIPDFYLMTLIRTSQGVLEYQRYELEASKKFHSSALVYADQSNNPFMKASCLQNLGSLSGELGRLDEADSYFFSALKLRREIGDRVGIANAQFNLGCSLINRGRSKDALLLLNEAYLEITELGNTNIQIDCLHALVIASHYAGVPASANRNLELVSPLLKLTGSTTVLAQHAALHSEILIDRAEYGEVLNYINDPLIVSGADSQPSIRSTLLSAEAYSKFRLQGNRTDALFAEALRLALDCNSVEAEIITRLRHAEVLIECGESHDAERLLVEAHEQAERTGFMRFHQKLESLLGSLRDANPTTDLPLTDCVRRGDPIN